VLSSVKIGVLAGLAALALSACGGQEEIVRDDFSVRRDGRFAAGASSYVKYCGLCHGVSGQGYVADHAPSLVSATFLESASDEVIAKGIREGRPGTAMAPYGKARGGPLDEEEIGAIITYLRELGAVRVPTPFPAKPVVGDPAAGELVYEASCKACHGTRTERGNAVHLANTTFLAAANDGFLRHAITRGRPGTPMPGFEGVLREDEIDNVVAL